VGCQYNTGAGRSRVNSRSGSGFVTNTYDDPPNIPDQSNIINTVANAKCRSKIDLRDGYHNLRIIPEHEKHTAFKTPFGVY